jgi:Flp pilus assembly protein TadG
MESRTAAPGRASAANPHRSGTSASMGWPPMTTTRQAVFEFSLISVSCFVVVLAAIDLSRAFYTYDQLRDAVGAGVRYGERHPADAGGITTQVVTSGHALRLTPADVTISCPDRRGDETTAVTVSARATFTGITQQLFGLNPITLKTARTISASSPANDGI